LRRWRAPRRGSVGAGRRRSHRSDGPPLGELGPATTRRFGRPSRTTRPGWRDQTGYGRGGVQQHHAGNLVGTGGGEGEDVQAAEGVTGEHVGPGNVCAWSIQQSVEVGCCLDGVLWTVGRVAPASTSTVVHADPGVTRDDRRYPPHRGGDLTQAWLQDHCGAAGAGAVRVQPMHAHIDELAGRG
jgi:hypothetical protein